MNRIFRRSQVVVYAAIAVATYWLLSLFVPTKTLVILFNGLFLGLVVSVTIVFFPLFLRAIKAREFDRVSQLTLGIICTWCSLIISRSINVVGQVTDNMTAAASSPFVPLAAYVAIIGGVLHITAPGMIEAKLEYNRGLLVLSAAIGAVAAIVAIVAQGN